MQNKANFAKGQISVTSYCIKRYENLGVCKPGENKAKQSQFEAKANVKMGKLYFSQWRTAPTFVGQT